MVLATRLMNSSAARIIPASTATVKSANTVRPNVTSHTLMSVLVSLSNCGISRFLARPAAWASPSPNPGETSEPYDFILNGGYGFLRVQVKSTARYAESRYRVKGGGWDDDCYTRDDIDFLVAYIVPENLWYVVPIAAFVSRKNLRFYPHGGRKADMKNIAKPGA